MMDRPAGRIPLLVTLVVLTCLAASGRAQQKPGQLTERYSSKPGALSYASAGIGSTAHLGTELLKFMAGGVDIVHVPYKGYGQALTDLIGGRIQMAISSGIAATPHLRSGKLKAIAVTGLRRMQAFPDLPTISESGVPGFDLESKRRVRNAHADTIYGAPCAPYTPPQCDGQRGLAIMHFSAMQPDRYPPVSCRI